MRTEEILVSIHSAQMDYVFPLLVGGSLRPGIITPSSEAAQDGEGYETYLVHHNIVCAAEVGASRL